MDTLNISHHRRLNIALGCICVLLVAAYGCLVWNYGLIKIHVKFAEDQTKIFEEERVEALQCDPGGAVRHLAYVINYYPSSTKQNAGSELDKIVERERSLSVRDIISYLRTNTGEDLGEAPEPWIKKYGQR